MQVYNVRVTDVENVEATGEAAAIAKVMQRLMGAGFNPQTDVDYEPDAFEAEEGTELTLY